MARTESLMPMPTGQQRRPWATPLIPGRRDEEGQRLIERAMLLGQVRTYDLASPRSNLVEHAELPLHRLLARVKDALVRHGDPLLRCPRPARVR